VRKAEGARFLSEGEESEALRINGASKKWGQAPFSAVMSSS